MIGYLGDQRGQNLPRFGLRRSLFKDENSGERRQQKYDQEQAAQSFSAFWKYSAAFMCCKHLHHAITNSRSAE
jgi:hypothetical protein